MIIIDKNHGKKIPYEEMGSKVCFDDDLTINLAKREEDSSVHIDVCYDKEGALVIGSSVGRSYVAEIDIPARRYKEIEDEEEKLFDAEADNETVVRSYTHREPLPLDMSKVTLTLWSID